MEEKMFSKCMEWLGDVDEECVSVVCSEDEFFWIKRIYLAAWNDDDGYTHVYLIRVFTMDNGKTINLSQDYENCVRIIDFVSIIPEIVDAISAVK